MSEESCLIVSSTGIAKSCMYRNNVLISSVKNVLFKVPSSLKFKKQVDTIYVCTDAIGEFIKHILPTLTRKFVLVTGDSDSIIPIYYLEYSSIILNNPKLLGWFSQNCFGGHPKLHQIPIGINYHTLSDPSHHSGWGESISSIDQDIMLRDIESRSLPFFNRIKKCYGTFHINSYGGYLVQDRIDAKNLINSSLIDYQDGPLKRKTLWIEMSKYTFIPSPEGKGPDCHRTWEALVLGCIPIVKTSPLDPMFEGLPVWIVQSWSDITQEGMDQKILEYTKTPPDYSKLKLDYWVKKINNYSNF